MLPNILVGERAPKSEVSYASTLETSWQSLNIFSFLKGNRVNVFKWLGWVGIKTEITLSISYKTLRSHARLSYWIYVSFLLYYINSFMFTLWIWILLLSSLATTTWLLSLMLFEQFITLLGVSSLSCFSILLLPSLSPGTRGLFETFL